MVSWWCLWSWSNDCFPLRGARASGQRASPQKTQVRHRSDQHLISSQWKTNLWSELLQHGWIYIGQLCGSFSFNQTWCNCPLTLGGVRFVPGRRILKRKGFQLDFPLLSFQFPAPYKSWVEEEFSWFLLSHWTEREKTAQLCVFHQEYCVGQENALFFAWVSLKNKG